MAHDIEPVVILGAGFAGLQAAKRLGRRGVRTTVVDRRNYHLFQPLLYQVVTAALSPADIASAIRSLLGRYESVDVLMDAPTAIDREARTVTLAQGRTLEYGTLIVATGSQYSYFGNADWAAIAPGPKSLEDAVGMRSRVLSAFERAEAAHTPEKRARLMTFVIVGGGPTGVELAGALSELTRHTLKRDFRHISPQDARIVVIEASDRLLGPFSEAHAHYVARELEARGVELRLSEMVESVTPESVSVGADTIYSETVFWAAGVGASPVGAMLGVECAKGGTVPVARNLGLDNDPRVFVIGDLAAASDEAGTPYPALAQTAKQQGDHVGKQLARVARGKGDIVPPFHYRPLGNTAIVARNAAIFEAGRLQLKGFPAWALWVAAHIVLLAGPSKKALVTLQWFWSYVTATRSARLITRWQDLRDAEDKSATPKS